MTSAHIQNKSEKSPVESKLAANLSALLSQHHVSIDTVAKQLNMPPMTLRRLATGNTINPRILTLQLIADYFDVSIDSLLNGRYEHGVCKPGQSSVCFVPLVNWETAQTIQNINELDLNTWKTWQPVSLGQQSIGEHCFALPSRPSMGPRFPQGTVFIIDADEKPVDGDIVLARIKSSNEITLRELIVDPPEWQLHSMTPGISSLHYTDDTISIIGVNVITLFYNR